MDEHYRLLNQSYVHGVMKGEAMSSKLRLRLKFHKFIHAHDSYTLCIIHNITLSLYQSRILSYKNLSEAGSSLLQNFLKKPQNIPTVYIIISQDFQEAKVK